MRFSSIGLLTAVALWAFSVSISFGQASESPPHPQQISDASWQGIRSAHETARHAAFAVPAGYQVNNPGQDWTTTFDGHGFLTQPRSGTWVWGLQLESYGFPDCEKIVAGGVLPSANGSRVIYDWEDNLQEWYVNDPRGLEHGYTLQSRPPGHGKGGPLTLELAVRGDLKANSIPGARGVRFVNSQGQSILTYTGLRVFDADGVDQIASLEIRGTNIAIVVNEASARYPLTIDPIAQSAYLKASNTGQDDRFGMSVAVSGDTVVVGAFGERSQFGGINGNQTDDSLHDAGAAYVFVRNGNSWVQQAYLKASAPGANDHFGFSVSVSGDTIVVGAYAEDSDATGINGDPFNNDAQSSGAAYVFHRSGTTWSQQAYLKASNTGTGDHFGGSVSISGNLIVVGAPLESSDSTGVNGDPFNDGMWYSGAAFVFERSGTVWSQQAYLKPLNTDTDDVFGVSVSISGETLVVGAVREDSDALDVDGDPFNRDSWDSGAAYVFSRIAGVWDQRAYLKASDTHTRSEFGQSLNISGNTVVVGAWLHERARGAAYVFVKTGSIWTPQAKLVASSGDISDGFGISSAIHGDTILIGATGDSGASTGVNGNPENHSTTEHSGAAFLFARSGSTWTEIAYLKSSNVGARDSFGSAVALSENLAIVGTPNEDSHATGVDGDGSDNSLSNSGAAYIFDLAAPVGTYCDGAPVNSSGLSGVLSMLGSRVATDNNFGLRAEGLPVNQFGFFLNSMQHAFVPNPAGSQGHLCLGGAQVGRHNRAGEIRNSGGAGSFDLTLDLNNVPQPGGVTTILAGETWNFQAWFRDQNPSSTSNFTNGLSVLFE